MILLSHPTGNTFARAVLSGFHQARLLDSFHTTIACQQSDWLVRMAPPKLRDELLRRQYDLPRVKIVTHPLRELVRLAAPKCGLEVLTAHEQGWASIDQVCHQLDRAVSRFLQPDQATRTKNTSSQLTAVYCYEDSALHTFKAAKSRGLKCIYDLPIAYWTTVQKLLSEEAERLPEWEPTLIGTQDSQSKLARKTEELALADLVVCPSKFVYDSLPEEVTKANRAIVAEFGSPPADRLLLQKHCRASGKLRVLFAGAMSQRKGLSDLFAAMNLLARSDVELVVMGTALAPMEFYRKHFNQFTYEPPRTHDAVLSLMQSCHLLVLPSIVEGRALVQQEALTCGLPLIVTANAGGQDLIDEGKTGFLVPIRSPERIAERLSWCADNRDRLEEMSELASQKAALTTWENYQNKILDAIRLVVEQQEPT
jgi:glycosyltransferase involved in cell wall biosynthesis